MTIKSLLAESVLSLDLARVPPLHCALSVNYGVQCCEASPVLPPTHSLSGTHNGKAKERGGDGVKSGEQREGGWHLMSAFTGEKEEQEEEEGREKVG